MERETHSKTLWTHLSPLSFSLFEGGSINTSLLSPLFITLLERRRRRRRRRDTFPLRDAAREGVGGSVDTWRGERRGEATFMVAHAPKGETER